MGLLGRAAQLGRLRSSGAAGVYIYIYYLYANTALWSLFDGISGVLAGSIGGAGEGSMELVTRGG